MSIRLKIGITLATLAFAGAALAQTPPPNRRAFAAISFRSTATC